jgi:phenylalanyl-tRNA synthetase beta chain
MGELHPIVQARFDLAESPVAACELDLTGLLQAKAASWTAKPIPAYPPALEDLALILDQEIPAEQVEAVIRRAGGELLTEARLFDVYQGAPIPKGRRSLAYALTYLAPDRTLTEVEVREIRERILASVAAELGGELRR